MVPYAVGIVQMENGVKLPGIIKNIPLEKIRIGMSLKNGIRGNTRKPKVGLNGQDTTLDLVDLLDQSWQIC